MRSADKYREMMDLVNIKLKDQNSLLETIKLSLGNSANFKFTKLKQTINSESETITDLKKIAEKAISERRQKLDYELCLMLRDRFQLTPGNLRQQFDECWSRCFSQSFEKHYQSGVVVGATVGGAAVGAGAAGAVAAIAAGPVILGTLGLVGIVYDNQLINIVSEAWDDYLKEVQCIIDKSWNEDKRD